MKNNSGASPVTHEIERNIRRRITVGKYAVLFLILIFCIGAHYLFRYFTYPHLALPRSFGFVKNMFDPLIVIFVYWGGWAFGVPWLVSLCLKVPFSGQLYLYLAASIAMGCVQTVVGFDSYSVIRFLRGVATYLAIFGIVYLVLFCASRILKGVLKCHH
ncbi:MAG: hypothetical protein Q7U78_13585 [Gallionella sp.]|nr:hypothetical protein [Gallionella sp.]